MTLISTLTTDEYAGEFTTVQNIVPEEKRGAGIVKREKETQATIAKWSLHTNTLIQGNFQYEMEGCEKKKKEKTQMDMTNKSWK